MNKWVALAVCALAGTMLSGGAESLSFLPTDTEIAFKREDQIYIMNADGSDQRMLASNNVAGDLAWSPDGRTLAFTRSTSGGPGFDLWQVAPETGKQQRLASQGLSNLDPT